MPIRRALEQPGAETLLELPHVPRDGRLADAQRARRAAQAARLCHGQKDAEIVPLHAPSLATPARPRAAPSVAGCPESERGVPFFATPAPPVCAV